MTRIPENPDSTPPCLRQPFLSAILAGLLVLLVGLLLRLPPENIAAGQHRLRPELLTLDGYYYARLATPDFAASSGLRDVLSPPPADNPMSTLPLLARLTRPMVRWIWLPPLFGAWTGTLLVLGIRCILPQLPLALNMAAVLAGCTAPYFLSRSSCGWFDTDALIIFALTLLLLSILFLAVRKNVAAILSLAAGSLLFSSTWEQAADVVLVFLFFYFGLYLWVAKDTRKHAFLTTILPLFLIHFAIIGPSILWTVPWMWLGRFNYLRNVMDTSYPTPAAMIEEQNTQALSEIFMITTGGWPLAAAVLAGCILLFRRFPRAALTILPALLLGWIAAYKAPRFAIFAAPVSALGLAVLGDVLMRWRRSRALLATALLLLLIAAAWQSYIARSLVASAIYPIEQRISAAMENMPRSDSTQQPPPIAWAWWDDGYEIQYRLGWQTLVDGGHHNGEHITIAATPLAMTHQEAAARYIRLVAHGGLEAARALEPLRSPGADGALAIQQHLLLSPSPPPALSTPVYLLLTARSAMAFPHILNCGGWQPEQCVGPNDFYLYLPQITNRQGHLQASGGLEIDIAGWRPEAEGKFIVLPSPSMQFSPPGYPARTGRLEVHLGTGHGALGAPRSLATVFHQLFIQRQPNPKAFRLLPGATKELVVYEVLPLGSPIGHASFDQK